MNKIPTNVCIFTLRNCIQCYSNITNKAATKLETAKITAGLTASTSFSNSKALHKYINNIRAMNKRTAKEYYLILNNFELFVISKYKITLDDIRTDIKQNSEDPYDI